MPDRVHYHPNLIFSLGTQVVTLVEVLNQNGKVLHPRGSVGVVIRYPADLDHPYRVRFADGIEESLHRDQLTMLARYKEAEIGDTGMSAIRCNLYERVIYRCVIGSQAYGLAGEDSDIDRRGIYLPPADLHWSLYGVSAALLKRDKKAQWTGPEKGDSIRINGDVVVFRATPQKEVVGTYGTKARKVDRKDDIPAPQLSESLQNYLECHSPWELKTLLTALAQCDSNDVVRLISSGNRRWWIGSFLDYAEKTLGPTAPDFLWLVSLFQIILQGYDCGKILPKSQAGSPSFLLPLILREDSDIRTSLWTEEETRFVVESFRSIWSENAKYSRPHSQVGIAPETDEEWTDWVHQMVGQIVALETFPLARRSVIGFIS